MASLYNADLKPLQPGTPTHPYNHAAKLFTADTFRLAPKQSYLYYVVINLDPSQTQLGGGPLSSILSFADRYQQFENGLLVKAIDLPKFSMATKTLNSYNRKNIVQTHIQYDPISVSFHDDAADVITKFWNDYYTFYYRDSDYGAENYRTPNKYAARKSDGWGFSPHNGGLSTSNQQEIYSFIKNIRIFSLHNKRFTEYMLVNPVITGWRHGQHSAAEGNSLMENNMTVAYETVKYFTGYVNPVNVDGFSMLHYDTVSSPISTSVTNIYSDAGLIGALDGAPKDLYRPDGQFGAGGPLSSILSIYKTYNNLKNLNLKTVVGTSLGSIGASVLNSTINQGLNYAFPIIGGGLSGIGGTQTIPTGQSLGLNGTGSTLTSGAVTIAGVFAGSATGAAVNSSNQVINGINANINRGVQTVLGVPVNPDSTKVYDATAVGGPIKVDPASLQVVTGSITGVITDDSGNPVSQFTTTGTKTGNYNPSNPTENLVSVQTTYDESGQTVVINKYQDGTQVIEDSEGTVIGVYPGAYINNNNINTNPTDTRTLALQGKTIPTNSVQYFTNPTTGITYSVGNTATAQITNTITGVSAATGGLFVGSALNNALNSSFLGKSIIGRTVATAVSTATGAAVGRAINNGLQPIINKVTGEIVQGFDSATGQIKNVVGSWTGSGGYTAARPLDNIVSQTVDGNGSNVYTYKDGTVRTVDAEGVQTITPGSNNSGLLSWFNGSSGQNKDSAAVAGAPGSILTDASGNPVYTGTGEYTNIGDPSLSPTALTQDQWDAMGRADQEALNSWMDSSGNPGPDIGYSANGDLVTENSSDFYIPDDSSYNYEA